VKLERRDHCVHCQDPRRSRKIRSFDWEKLNPQRGALIERFKPRDQAVTLCNPLI